MRSLYDHILSNNAVPGAYGAWKEYREALTAFILENAKRGGSCLIVGAGACSDIDAARLADDFDTVTLLDRDAAALAEALRRYPAPNVCARQADLLGVTEAQYRALDEDTVSDIRAGADGEALTAAFLKRTERLLGEARPDPLPEADTVVCCGVHSQLLATFARLAALYGQLSGMDTGRVFETLSRYNAAWQPVFNGRLFAAARSSLVIGLDIRRQGVPGGIEGAAQALADLVRRRSGGVQAELTWPFDAAQNKIYTVQLIAIDRQAAV